ncbi:PulJ/GspJ family protein [Mangrovihabitans endophyticus]|uniref:Prepilin-type N-terminal cleavage/methylation domain-containing protein n=1 Tax=Mangrovihabitans endophyticus TaxID=1751298 RepID=A0A8J3C8S3_9ACTN|nr:type II secretion system protein [Mangrovihabitans endophyticus]GGL19205.1 hypothetical protein GCM10012284_62160 [Mangrovihabitans endophyticus]
MVPTTRRRVSGDAGFTLLEVVVAFGVMSLAGALFTAGIARMHAAASAGEEVSVAAAQAHQAFLRLDRELRYSDGISEPGTVDATGRTYVEYRTTALAGAITCTQMRLDPAAGVLQVRSRVTSPGGVMGAVAAWHTLASYLNGPQSIVRHPADVAARHHQELEMALTVRAGAGEQSRARTVVYAFTALNTSPDTDSDTVCGDMARA